MSGSIPGSHPVSINILIGGGYGGAGQSPDIPHIAKDLDLSPVVPHHHLPPLLRYDRRDVHLCRLQPHADELVKDGLLLAFVIDVEHSADVVGGLSL